MAALTVIRPGLLTTVQDLGRWGFQSRGVPVSGAMDPYSHELANGLVGNPATAATLEVTLLGPQLRFEGDATVAVTGAAFELSVDGGRVAMNQPIALSAGSVLKFGPRTRGARSYVAFPGGIDVPQVLGSRSTHVRTGMGGFQGRALRAGDRLMTAKSASADLRGLRRKTSPSVPALPSGGARLRVVVQSQELFAQLAGQRFSVSPVSDRMGYRLDGPVLAGLVSGELLSIAVPVGALQIPPDGHPILLMADRATTGGYALAGTVITADLPLAAQLAPGDWIEFAACSLDAAVAALLEQEASLGGA